MKIVEKIKAVLLLEDGLFLEGYSEGVSGTTYGEMCFNTGMTGYQEIYTDPSYSGQIIINTTSHIGNYGTLQIENESHRVQFAGLVCNAFSSMYSRNKAENTLADYFRNSQTIAISGIDTRMLVRHIRHKGAMNGIISTEILDKTSLMNKLREVPSMAGLELSSRVSTKEAYFYGQSASTFKIAVLDLGIKRSILQNLAVRDMYCKVFPAKSTLNEIMEWNPDGFFISNGPGDPAVMQYAIDTVKGMLTLEKPLFGICLGHQLLAQACGVKTYKMHNGHRGLNHPVKNLLTGKSEITSQNHGFSVVKADVQNSNLVEATHINLNDGTVEGIRLKDKKAFSVQYHPEAAPGPHDSRYLFNDFYQMLKSC